eukprot:snap_masked-scaffold670_size114954-processed-gene-0.15 protein:Tk01659 transcript:snap_masked-scaffold670_size114954-processed-gene-0.15-mRNA-1 annotation:"predicted protein"
MYQWHGKDYLGPAHGISGIYFTLLSVQAQLSKVDLSDIEQSLGELSCYQFPSGNFPSSLPPKDDRLVQWCHGAPGVIHLYLKAARVFPHQRSTYLEIACKCAKSIWDRGLLTKGYGLCHGVAGNAYGFLELFAQTTEPMYLNLAAEFGRWCLDHGSYGCETPDEPLSLFSGLAGTIVFFADLEALWLPNSKLGVSAGFLRFIRDNHTKTLPAPLAVAGSGCASDAAGMQQSFTRSRCGYA